MKKLPRFGFQKKHGARPACRDGGVFEKTSASLLAREFAKKLLHSRSNKPRDFSASPSVLIRAIRG